jgi:hypothetical protein
LLASGPLLERPVLRDGVMDLGQPRRMVGATHHRDDRMSVGEGSVLPDGAAELMLMVSLRGMASRTSSSTAGGNICNRGGLVLSRRHPSTAGAGQRRSWRPPPRPLPCVRMVHVRATVSGRWVG